MGRSGDNLSASEIALGSTITDLNSAIEGNNVLTAEQIQKAKDLQIELEAEAAHAADMTALIGELSNSYNVLQAQADLSLGNIHAAYDDCFAVGNFDAMAAMVADFAVKHNISLDEAKGVIDSYVAKVAEIPASIEEQLVGRAQANLQAFKDCATGKMVNIKDDNKAAWDTIVGDTNDLISSGLIGQAQENIKAFVDCSTGKQAKMVDDIDGYLKNLNDSYEVNTAKVAQLVSEGKDDEAAIYAAKGAEILATIKQLETWRNDIVTSAWALTKLTVEAGLAAELAAVSSAAARFDVLRASFGRAGVDAKDMIIAYKAVYAEAVAASSGLASSAVGPESAGLKKDELGRWYEERGGEKIFVPPNVISEEFPGYGEGGIVTSPTYALLGERGPEAVVPLDSYGFGPSLKDTLMDVIREGSGKPSVSIQITGPLVVVEGSADRATAELAAVLVEEKLRNVIVEASSSGAPSTSKMIRMGNRVAI
jgi:hypothetical protein